jgi:membrane-associated phospholipid phosphatase
MVFMNMEIWNKFPYFLIVIAVFLLQIPVAPRALLVVFVVGFVLTYIANNYEKRMIRELRPNAPDRIPPMDPDIFETELYFGNPSGHMQLIMYSITFFMLYMLSINEFSVKLIILMAAIGVFIGYSRIEQGYHTLDQILSGVRNGIIMGFISFTVYHIYVE